MSSGKARAGRLAYAAVLVALLAAATGASLLANGPQLRTCRSTAGNARVGMVRFIDTQRSTSLELQTDQRASNAGTFVFDAGVGSSYRGGPVQGLRPSPAGGDPLRCAGFLHLTFDGMATVTIAAAAPGHAMTSRANVHLDALVDLAHLTATIQFEDRTNHHGFTATTAAPANLYAAVAATTQATTRQDWAALYQLTSQATLGGLSAAEFAQVMERQAQAVGSITSITATSQPQLGSDPTGITFFTITEHVTVLHNGVLKSFDVIAVYILEGGAWKLWFTKQL